MSSVNIPDVEAALATVNDPEIKRPIDLAALTAAVERLLRRDLRLARERAGGKR